MPDPFIRQKIFGGVYMSEQMQLTKKEKGGIYLLRTKVVSRTVPSPSKSFISWAFLPSFLPSFRLD